MFERVFAVIPLTEVVQFDITLLLVFAYRLMLPWVIVVGGLVIGPTEKVIAVELTSFATIFDTMPS